jgi:hypothetical protein
MFKFRELTNYYLLICYEYYRSINCFTLNLFMEAYKSLFTSITNLILLIPLFEKFNIILSLILFSQACLYYLIWFKHILSMLEILDLILTHFESMIYPTFGSWRRHFWDTNRRRYVRRRSTSESVTVHRNQFRLLSWVSVSLRLRVNLIIWDSGVSLCQDRSDRWFV